MRSGWFEMTKANGLAVMALLAVLALCSAAIAQDKTSAPAEAPLSPSYRFSETSGEALFANVCRGCHMTDGKGAAGAGTYPSLAHNSNLETREYPVNVVLNGQRDMPPFGAMTIFGCVGSGPSSEPRFG